MTSQVNDTIQQLLNKITQQVAILAHQVDMLQIHNLLGLVPLSLADLSTKTPPITPPAPYPFNPNPVLDDYPKTISQPSNPDPLELPDPKVAATLVNSGSAREYAKVIANEQPKLDLKPRSLPVKKLYENIAKERESVFGKVCNLFEINPIPDGNRKINQQTLNLQVSIAALIFQKHDYVGKFVFDGEELVSEHNMFGKMFDCRFVSYENDNYIFYLNVEIKYRLIGGQKQVFIFDPGGRLIVGQLAPMGTRGSILYLNEKMLQLGIKLQLPRSMTGQNFDIMSDRLPITDIMAFSSISCSDLDPFGEQPNIYGDNSHTTELLSTETFYIGSASLPKMQFGCSHDSGGTFDSNATGIVGVGGGPLSLVSQLGSSNDHMSSYCLVSHESDVTSKINFGSNADVGPQALVTPLVEGESIISIP